MRKKTWLAATACIALGATPAAAFDLSGVGSWANGMKDATVGGAGAAWNATSSGAQQAAGAIAGAAQPAVGAALVVPAWTNDGWNHVRGMRLPEYQLSMLFDATGMMSMTEWLSIQRMQAWVEDWHVGARIDDARLAAASGMSMLPQDPIWWRDFGVTAVTVTAGVGGASAGCAAIATPAGPIAMAVSVGACGTGAAYGSSLAVQKGYELAGATIDADAMEWGTRVGLAVGTLGGNRLMQMSIGEMQIVGMREVGQFGSLAGTMADRAMEAVEGYVHPEEQVIVVDAEEPLPR